MSLLLVPVPPDLQQLRGLRARAEKFCLQMPMNFLEISPVATVSLLALSRNLVDLVLLSGQKLVLPILDCAQMVLVKPCTCHGQADLSPIMEVRRRGWYWTQKSVKLL
jgi:hypothetical protein